MWPAVKHAHSASGGLDLSRPTPLALALRLFFQCLTHSGGSIQGSAEGGGSDFACSAGAHAAMLQEVLGFTKALLYRLCWVERAALDTLLPCRPTHTLALLADTMGAFNALFHWHSRHKLARSSAGGGSGAPGALRDEDFLFPAIPKEELTPDIIKGLSAEDEGEQAPALAMAVEGAAGSGSAGSGSGSSSSSSALPMAAGGGGGAMGAAAGEEEVVLEQLQQQPDPAARSTPLRARLRAARVLLILTCFPHTVPLSTRARLFHSLANGDREGFARTPIRVRRTRIVEDAFREFEKILHHSPQALLNRLKVTFISADVRLCPARSRPNSCRFLSISLTHTTHTHTQTPTHARNAILPPLSAGDGGGWH